MKKARLERKKERLHAGVKELAPLLGKENARRRKAGAQQGSQESIVRPPCIEGESGGRCGVTLRTLPVKGGLQGAKKSPTTRD